MLVLLAEEEEKKDQNHHRQKDLLLGCCQEVVRAEHGRVALLLVLFSLFFTAPLLANCALVLVVLFFVL